MADETISGKNNEERLKGDTAMTVACGNWTETDSFMEGYVWGYRKGCLSVCEKCLKALDDSPEELRAMLRSEISRLCQEIEDNKK